MAFEETLDFQLRFSEKGIDQVVAKFESIFSKFAGQAAGGGVSPTDVGRQFQQASSAYIAQARAQVQTLPGFQQDFGNTLVTNLATRLKALQDGLVSAIKQSISPEGISAQVQQELAARGLAASKSIVTNSRLLGEDVPAQAFTNQGGLTGGSTQFVSAAESLQQKEAYAAVTASLVEAREQIAQYNAIQKRGIQDYADELGTAAADDRIINANILTAKRQVLAQTEGYAETVGEGVLAQKDIDSQIKQAMNARLLGTDVAVGAGAPGVTSEDVAASQAKLAESADAGAGEIDTSVLRIRDGANAVSDAMLKAAATLSEISAIESLPGGMQAYAAEQAQATFKLRLLDQAIETETLEREAGSAEYKALTTRANAANEKLGNATNAAAAALESSAGGTTFQRLQASFFNRFGNAPRDVSSFPQLGQFLGQKALTTGGFAVSGAAFYGTFQGIRTSVEEANKLQVALVNLQEEFKAADDSGDFPKARSAILDLSNSSGIAASEIAQITTTFKGAFGDTTRAIDETTAAVQLVIATGLGLQDVTNTVLAIDQAFGVTSTSIGDVTLSLQELTGVSAKETINALGQIAPVADQIGLSFKSTAALLAESEQLSGRSSQTIAENFNRILPAIQKNGVAILGLIQSVPGLGAEFQQLGQDLNEGSEGKFFTDLIQVFGKLGPVAQNTIIELLGGRREAGALIPVLQNAAKYNDLVAKATDNNGKTQAYAAAQYATLSKQLGIVRAEFQNLIGDILRGGLASGITDILSVVAQLFSAVVKVEGVFSDINKLSHGIVGDVAAGALAFGAYKGISGVLGGARGALDIGEKSGLNASAVALSDSAVNLNEAALALRTGGVGGAVPPAILPPAAEGAAANAGVLGAYGIENGIRTTAPSFGGLISGVSAGEGASAGALLGSLGTLPLSLGVGATVLFGIAGYQQAVKNASQQNQAAAAAAQKFVDNYLKQRKDLEATLIDFGRGNKVFKLPPGITSAQLPFVADEQQINNSSKTLSDFINNLQDNVVQQQKDAYTRALQSGKAAVTTQTGGQSAQKLLQGIGNIASHLPGLGSLRTDSDPNGWDTVLGDVKEDVRKKITTDALIPFLDQYIKDVTSNSFSVLSAPDSKLNKNAVLGGVTVPDVDPHGRAAAAAKEQAAAAADALNEVKKRLGDGSSKANFDYAVKYIDALEANPKTSADTKQVFRQVQDKIDQARAAIHLNDTTTDLATQKQLVAAGAESFKTYLVNYADEIDGLTQLADNDPLTPPLRLQLATDQKEAIDNFNTLADAAQADADFLAGLNRQGGALAATKYADALAKFASLPEGDPSRTQAAQDALTAFQASTSSRLSNEDPAKAYADAINGIALPPDLVDAIVADEKKKNEADQAYLLRRVDFYNKEISRLKAQQGSGDDSSRTKAALAKAQRSELAYKSALDSIKQQGANLDNSKTLKDIADAQTASADLFAKATLQAGDDPVKQAQATLAKDARDVQIAVESQTGVTAAVIQYYKDFHALVIAQDDAAYQIALGQNAVQQALDAGNPQALAQDRATQGRLEEQEGQKLTQQGNTQAGQQLLQQGKIDTIGANQAAQAASDAIAKAKLDLLSASTQDAVTIAQIAIQQADLEYQQAAAAGDKAGEIEAQAHKIQAERALADTISQEADAVDQLLEAVANFYGDVYKAATIGVAEALRHLQEDIKEGKDKGVIKQAAGQYIDALATQRDDLLQQQEDTIQFNLDLNKISASTAISLYQALLGTKNITLQERRDILEKIYQLQQSLNQDLQFNLPSDLQLPTLYEARRFVQGGGASAFSPQNASQFNDNRQITIEVNGAGDPASVASAVVQALNVPTRYATRPRIY